MKERTLFLGLVFLLVACAGQEFDEDNRNQARAKVSDQERY